MQKKIKILHVQETIGSGGVERRRLSMAKHLNKEQFDQKFVCTIAKGNIPEEIRAEGFEVIALGELKSPFHWKQHKKVQRIIDEYKPDIIHGAVFEGVTMAAINGWIKKVPIIIIEETSDPQNRSWKGNLLMKLFAKMADKVIGVSPSVLEEYLKGKLNLAERKVILINNGVAKPRFVGPKEILNLKYDLGISEDDFIIGSVGRMLSDANKRFSDLINAFAQFSIGKNNVKLLLVGDGPERQNYIEQVNNLNITDKVIFVGYQSDTSPYYNLMDVFSLVSRNESFGLVLAEAMLNKLPVVATRVGGMKYIVEDQQTGFLVEPFQIQEIQEKLEIFYTDESLKNQMGEAGYLKAMKEYTEVSYVKRIRNLYLNEYNKKT